MRVALMVDDVDWHARRMLAGFVAAGVEAVAVRLAACGFETGRPEGLGIPGFEGLPDGVFVRSISAGSFEEVTRRLGVLHALRECGVPVWNDARAIERCVDKSMTSFLLARAGVPTPATWAVEGEEAAREVVAREAPAGPLVVKPLFGSQGRGLRLVRGVGDLPGREEVAGVYYLQRYVPTGVEAFRDYRLFVCAGEVVAGMTRHAPVWITNVRQGGRPEALAPDGELAGLALRAAASVGADYAGVDILRDAEGRPWVLEVNSMPGWKGLQEVTAVSIAGHLAAAMAAALR